MPTIAGAGGVKPPMFIIFVTGLIIILVRWLFTMLYIWAACLAAIIGGQLLTGAITVETFNLFALPAYYYHSAAYMAIAFAVLAGMLKVALNEGLFYTYSKDDQAQHSEHPEKPKEQ